ncbi:hypothetical protein, partial [uncultured Parabacteroides sp.]|uniref:hypothetical protein n=1 Tax=uncultured Parabacteroides sp. TaxID=512312 RepID=UPI0025FB428B
MGATVAGVNIGDYGSDLFFREVRPGVTAPAFVGHFALVETGIVQHRRQFDHIGMAGARKEGGGGPE